MDFFKRITSLHKMVLFRTFSTAIILFSGMGEAGTELYYKSFDKGSCNNMPEKKSLSHRDIIYCLNTHYSIAVTKLILLPLLLIVVINKFKLISLIPVSRPTLR